MVRSKGGRKALGRNAPQTGCQPQAAVARAAADTRPLRPWLAAGAMALMVARPLYPSESAAQHGDGLLIVLFWFLLAVLWLVDELAAGRPRVRFGWPEVAFVALVLWQAISALVALRCGCPRPAMNMLWEWVGYGLSFLLLRQLFLTQRQCRAAVAVMAGLAIALSVYGLYQFAWELPATEARYWQNPDQLLREQGLWYEPGSRERYLFEQRLKSREPMATFALTNSLAGFLVPWLVVLVAVTAAGWNDQQGNRIAAVGRVVGRAAAGLGAALVAACVVVTKSRSGLMAALVGAGGALWWAWPVARRRTWPVAAAAGLGVAAMVAAALASGAWDVQVFTEAGKSLGYRLQYWKATMRIVAAEPVFGCGPGNFRYAYTRYMAPEASEEIAEPHNFLLEVWSTAGTPAAVALVAWIAIAGWQVTRPRRSPRAADQPNGGRFGLFVLAGGAVGVLLSVPAGWLGPAPPGLNVLLVGMPVGVVGTGLLWNWVRRGQLPRYVPAAAVVGCAVNLLASGGIGFPGVAGSLWLLAALALNLTETSQPRRLPMSLGVAAFVFVLALAAVFVFSGYLPVIRATSAMRLAAQQPALAETYLRQAAQADPLSAEPLAQLAALAFQRWKGHPAAEQFQCFRQYAEAALRRAPNSQAARFHTAKWYEEAYQLTGRAEYLERAITLYAEAAELYPNSSLHHARLAVALALKGDQRRAAEEARRALHLDQINPHPDKRLQPELRRRVERISWQKEAS